MTNKQEKDIEKLLRKITNADEKQAANLNIILHIAFETKDFSYLYKYLLSEIEFRGGIDYFVKNAELSRKELEHFLYSEKMPDIVLLNKVLNGLKFRLLIACDDKK